MSQEKKKIVIEKPTWDATFNLISWWDVARIREAKVMVVGAGALGNEVLKNLALLNVGHIVLVDFDHIEYSNLSRSILFRVEDSQQRRRKVDVAAERIKEINPNVKVKTIHGDVLIDVGLGIYREMDVIIGCLDNRLARLFINKHAFWMNKIWVDGAVENLSGQLNVFEPGIHCYESNLSEIDWINIKQRVGCPTVAARNASAGRIPTTPISASIIAAMQVQEAFKVINGNINKLIRGKTFYYDGMNNEWVAYKTSPPDPDAESSMSFQEIIEIDNLSHQHTLKQVLNRLSAHFDSNDIEIELRHSVVTQLKNETTGEEFDITPIPKLKITEELLSQYKTHAEDDIRYTNLISQFDRNFFDLNINLHQLGVPALEILKVYTETDQHFVAFGADEDFLTFN